jgi:sugar/nucleoside kinase (ribokinase family)
MRAARRRRQLRPRRSAGQGVTTSLDPGCDLSERWGADLLDVLAEVDLFFADQAELERVTGCPELPDALARLDSGATRTIVTRGPRDEGFVPRHLHAYVDGSAGGEPRGVGGSPTSSAFIA